MTGSPYPRTSRDQRLPPHLALPFFSDDHRLLALELDAWAAAEIATLIVHEDVDRTCRRLVAALGASGWLSVTMPASCGGRFASLDVRAIALCREILAYHAGLADFAFAMQGLGSAPITLFGTEPLRRRYLPPVREGRSLAAFALSEPEAGSHVAALSTKATPDGPGFVRIDGVKTWISNGGIADHYVVFAREGDGAGGRAISAFVVDADSAGLAVSDRISITAPHPMATLTFDGCRVPEANRLLGTGDGFRIAMATLDIFRSTVGAAAVGFSRRALDAALERAATRRLGDAVLADMQLTQAALADSATEIDAAQLLIYRAAWIKDSGAPRITREAAMAKMFATEAAQHIVDRAVQLHGAEGVRSGSVTEELYREVRALRIYEGATEVQKTIIARDLLKERLST